MKRFGKVLIAAILIIALSLQFSVISALAAGGNAADDDKTVDFVLVLDCSGTMKTTDRYGLCLTACKMFLDMVPLENARIGIITFGYQDSSKRYGDLEVFQVENTQDLTWVNRLFDLQEVNYLQGNVEGVLNKSIVKAQVSEEVGREGNKTPLGTATMAAVDMLSASGASDGNACVILLTDGKVSAQQSWPKDKENARTAATEAGKRGWPIYALQMNANYSSDSDAAALMQEIAERSGANEDGNGYSELTEFESGKTEIATVFLSIFDRFMGNKGNTHQEKADSDGIVRCSFEVDKLTSESTVVVCGESITKVELISPYGSTITVDKSFEQDNVVASMETRAYVCVKLICPEEGTWNVVVYGDPGASIVMYECSMQDMDLVLTASVSEGSLIGKNDTITYTATFTYHGMPIPATNRFYKEKQPVLEFTTTSGAPIQKQMSADDTGYTLTVRVGDVAERGAIVARARIEDPMFRNGSKTSNAYTVKTENLPLKITDPELGPITGSVGTRGKEIDINTHVENLDFDKLEYTAIVPVSDRAAYEASGLQLRIDDENNYLFIDNFGNRLGTYVVSIGVREKDSNEEFIMFSDLSITVTETPFTFEKPLSEVELWVDYYPLVQPEPIDSVTFDISEGYFDADGVPPIVQFLNNPGEGEFYTLSRDGNTVTLEPIAKGEGELRYSISDGYNEQEYTVKISIVSGKSIFWGHNWFWVALIGGLIVLAIIVIVILKASTRVKGDWDVCANTTGDAYRNDKVSGINAATMLIGKKKQFYLKDFLDAIGPFWRDNLTPQEINTFFSNAPSANKIKMKGVLSSRGFVLCDVPKNGFVNVTYNGAEVKGSVKHSGGTLCITLAKTENDFANNVLVITISPAGLGSPIIY